MQVEWKDIEKEKPKFLQEVLYVFKGAVYCGAYDGMTDKELGNIDMFCGAHGYLTNDVKYWYPLDCIAIPEEDFDKKT